MPVDPTALVSGIGIGVIATKLLDIFLLQKKIDQQQYNQWLRDRRLEAFSQVSKEFMSFGLHGGKLPNPFESYGEISKALLLIEDDKLVERLDLFIVEADALHTLKKTDPGEAAKADKLYKKLNGDARALTATLRTLLLHDNVRR